VLRASTANCSCWTSTYPSEAFPVGCSEAPRDPELAQRWLAFVRNHREPIAAMDFFTVPTVTFKLLYCLFIISHERRQILHVNVTRHPTSAWIAQQL